MQYPGSRILMAMMLVSMVTSLARAQISPPSPDCAASVEEAMGEYAECRLEAEASFEEERREGRLAREQRRCVRQLKRRVHRARHRFGLENCTPITIETIQAQTEEFVSTAIDTANRRFSGTSPIPDDHQGCLFTQTQQGTSSGVGADGQVRAAHTAVSDGPQCEVMCRKMAAMVTMMPRMVAGMQSMMNDMLAGMRQMMGCAVPSPSQACEEIESAQEAMMAGMNERMNTMVNVMMPGGAMFESMLVNKMECPSVVPGTSPAEDCRAIADIMQGMTSGMLIQMERMIPLMRGAMERQMIHTLNCSGLEDRAPICRGMVSMMNSMTAMMEQMLPRMTQMMNGPMIQNMLSMMGCGESSGGMPMMSCQSPSSSSLEPCGASSGMPMMSCGGISRMAWMMSCGTSSSTHGLP